MAKFTVKYQTINRKTKTPCGTMTKIVTASNLWEARQEFKFRHVDTASMTYKIVAVIKTAK